MLKIAICDDSKVDVEQLENALNTLCGYQIEYDVYFSAVDLLEYGHSTGKTIIYISLTSKCPA